MGDWGEVGLLGDLSRVSTALAWLCGHALGRYASCLPNHHLCLKKERGRGGFREPSYRIRCSPLCKHGYPMVEMDIHIFCRVSGFDIGP